MRFLCHILLLGLALSVLFSRCASVAAPQGGPRDSLPPRVVSLSPTANSVNFTGTRIVVEFDEFVKVQNQQAQVFTSPLMRKMPTITMRGRSIQIDITDTLAADQTYAIHFGNAIVDNNESNPLSDFSYVFSTGEAIDSLFMSGWAVDAYTRDSAPETFIFFYPDTLPLSEGGVDSTLFRAPAAVARSQGNGLFIAKNLKPMPYRIYAMQDANGNRTYEPGVDRVGFIDSVCNPERMPGFSVRYDTLLRRYLPDPQLYFRMFSDAGFQRQLLRSATRPVQHRVDLVFSALYPQIDSLTLDGIAPEQIIVQQLKPTGDSLFLWLNVADSLLPDTIRGSILYHRHDSINILQPYRHALELVWRDLSHLSKRDTLPEKPANPFKMQVDAAQELNPFNNIGLTFDHPLVQLDSARVELLRLVWPDGEEQSDSLLQLVPQPVHFEQDSLDMRRWTLRSAWVDEANYRLMIPAGAFVDVAGQRNDTLRASFHIIPAERFASLDLKIVSPDTLHEYVVEITNNSGALLRSFPHVRTGAINIPYLLPGTIRIRIIEDLNGNGKWDAGNLLHRLQPERAEIFSPTPESPDIALKENWSYDQTIDMGRIFTPITMESLQQELYQIAIARQAAYIKAQAEQQKQQQQQQNPNQGMGFGNIGNNPLPMPTPR